MAKAIPDAELDLLADDLIANGDEMVACSDQPATYEEAHSTLMLASVALAGGDYTKAPGGTDGRKVTVAAKEGVSVTNPGTATHVAIVDTVAEVLKAVTTCNSQALAAGGTVDFPAWTITLRDPT